MSSPSAISYGTSCARSPQKPEFAPVVDMLAIGPETHDRIAAASLALYAATLDFCALHAVTGTHWLRLMAPRTARRATPLRYFWQAIASLFPKIGFPALPSADELEAWRRMRPARLARDLSRGGRRATTSMI